MGVLVEERRAIAQEYYAAVTWDARAKKPVIIFSDMGGIDIEQVAEEHPEHGGPAALLQRPPVHEFIAKVAIAVSGVTGTGPRQAVTRS